MNFLKTVKGIITTILLVVILIVVLFWSLKLKSCSNPNVGITETPKDTNFVPIVKQKYRPPSINIFSRKKLPVKLPSGVKERDVDRILTIFSKNPKDTTNIIETKDGDVYIAKDSTIERVTVTDVESPVVRLSFDLGLGGTLTSKFWFSPAGCVSFAEWYGKVQAPIVAVDLDGLNIGGQYRLYYNLHVGVANCWKYEGGNQVKLCMSFMF